ncbi:DUF4153 domain-containing protein [Deinococcus koreensis]|uniref:Uncharacterized protein n=1 Tax=Deinococcus koreensis TaxID=2054903 RepID=A0A2K3UWM3_9DEIO|nr:DUF4173 domain-containing protein [Deinococcus koreensis]PNY80937.1 hypothetical protein CVO96_05725 [Deinococcus koreensis]
MTSEASGSSAGPLLLTPAPPTAHTLPRPAKRALPLGLALGLAVAAHGLTRGAGPAGLNLPLIILLFSGVALWGLRRRPSDLPSAEPFPPATPSPEGLLLLGTALAFGVGFTLRGVPETLGFLNALALGLCLLLGAAFLRFPGLSGAGVWGMVGATLGGALRLIYGPLALLERFPWARLQVARGTGLSRAVVGAALTLPVLLVFGGLLGRADQGFGQLLAGLLHWQMTGLIQHTFTLVWWAALMGGLLYPALMALRPTPFPPSGIVLPRLGLIEVGLPLGALSALFVVFVLTQLPYFLSGGTLPDGLTFAEYIRKGFGELMTVAFLSLMLLLSAFALTRPDVRAGLPYRLLNLAVLAPLALVILSAANRWQLYTQAYGLSEIRVLGAAFLVWVVLALAGLTWALWRGEVRRFAFPALLLGCATLLGTTALDPAALIARVNIARQTAGTTNALRSQPQRADVAELLRLGPGSVPMIVANLDTLARVCGPAEDCADPRARQRVIDQLHDRYDAPRDPRVWNLAYARAHSLVQTLPPRSPSGDRSSHPSLD